MRRNLKKLAASGARPAIQYVLLARVKIKYYRKKAGTYIVETMIVGINRRGMTSNTSRDSNHAVGLDEER